MRGRGKDFVRSQGRLRATVGDGLRTGGSLRTRLAWCAAPLLCLAVIAASLLGFGAIAHGRLEGTAAHGEVSSAVEEGAQRERASSGEGSADTSARADDAGGGDATYDQDSLLGRSGAGEEEAGTGDSHASTAASLLAELDRLSADREAEEGQVAVELRMDEGLVPAACSVLQVYQGVEGARLYSSGYLDLKGNAWGAIVQARSGCIDVVTIAALEEDSASTVRAVRMFATDDAED